MQPHIPRLKMSVIDAFLPSPHFGFCYFSCLNYFKYEKKVERIFYHLCLSTYKYSL